MNPKVKTVLLVDDSEMDNFFHSEIIRRSGLVQDIRVAENGPAALHFLEDNRYISPDLIFLDINMPGMNGWEFLEKFKRLAADKKSRIVVVMLSTSLNPDDRKHADEIPEVKEYISKPLTKTALQAIVDKYFTSPEDVS